MSKTIQNTLENKTKFFALYWGLEFTGSDHYGEYMPGTWSEYPKYVDKQYLILKPLSSISDEDAIDIYSIMIPTGRSTEKERIFYGRSFIKNYDTTNETLEFAQSYLDIQRAIDFLRSRGYALPWMGLSVEQLIEYGWIKLKED